MAPLFKCPSISKSFRVYRCNWACNSSVFIVKQLMLICVCWGWVWVVGTQDPVGYMTSMIHDLNASTPRDVSSAPDTHQHHTQQWKAPATREVLRDMSGQYSSPTPGLLLLLLLFVFHILLLLLTLAFALARSCAHALSLPVTLAMMRRVMHASVCGVWCVTAQEAVTRGHERTWSSVTQRGRDTRT